MADFYEVVHVLDLDRTRALGIASSRGVVLGVPPDVLGIEDEPVLAGEEQDQYALAIVGSTYGLTALEFARPAKYSPEMTSTRR